jgi:hypothetical protein
MRKITKYIVNILFWLIVLQSASSLFAAKKTKVVMPEWVNTPSSVYPSSSYMTYVGSGADRQSAELDALKGIASVFGQSIKSDTKSSSRMTQAKENGMVANSSVSTIDQSIMKKVDIDSLIGVEVEFWFDQVSTWYSIAILDRAKATQIYQDMITTNLGTLNSILKRVDETDFSFDSYSLYDFAEDIALENEKHLKKLDIINQDASTSLKSKCVSSKDIRLKKTQLAKNIPIHVIVENDVDGRFEEAFYQAISKAGFRGSYDSKVRYLLIAKFSFEESTTSDNTTIRCKYNGESYILDTVEEQQIIPYSVSGRESHMNFNDAKGKAVNKIINKITSQYSQSVEDFLKEVVVE